MLARLLCSSLLLSESGGTFGGPAPRKRILVLGVILSRAFGLVTVISVSVVTTDFFILVSGFRSVIVNVDPNVLGTS